MSRFVLLFKILIDGYPILWKHTRMLFLAAVGASLFQSLISGFSIAIVIPIIQDPNTSVSFIPNLPILNQLSEWIGTFTLLERVRLAGFLVIGVIAFEALTDFLTNAFAYRLGYKLSRRWRSEIIRRALNLPLAQYNTESIGHVNSILNTFSVRATAHLSNVTTFTSTLINILIYFSVLMFISPQLTITLFSLLIILLLGWNGIVGNYLRKVSQDVNKANIDVNEYSLQILSGMKLIRLYGQENRVQFKHEEKDIVYFGNYLRQQILNVLAGSSFKALLFGLLGLTMIGTTFSFTQQPDTWLAVMLPFVIIAFRMMSPSMRLNRMQNGLHRSYADYEELIQFFDRTEILEDRSVTKQPLKSFETGITLENLSFAYPSDSDNFVLKDVSILIPKGQTTAIVGPSGSGKSTLLDLLLGLYEIEDKTLYVDGISMNDLNMSDWRSHIGVVSQDVFIFNDTVTNNLRFVRPDATQSEVEDAARLAYAHEFIEALPNGYNTMLGERGVRLSGGQRQRISIAQAIIANPDVLILDEATSALDSETEKAIQKTIQTLSQDRTVIVVAHRLSTVQFADQILVLVDGFLKEHGTHSELMATGEYYQRLVNLQQLLPE